MVLVRRPQQMLAFSVQDRDVGPIHLVGAVEIEVGVQILDVDPAVRRIGDAVDAGQGARVVHLAHDRFYVVDQADDVGAVVEADQPRSLRQQGLQILDLEVVGIAVHPPFLDHDPDLREPAPGAVVGLVILVGDDDLVAGLQNGAQGVRQDVDIAGRRRPDDDLVDIGVDQPGQHLAPGIDSFAGARGCGIGGAGLGLAGGHEVDGPLDHLLGHEGAAGVLHEHPVPGQRREEAAAERHVQGGFGRGRLGWGRLG